MFIKYITKTKQWLIWFVQIFTWHKSFKKNPIIGNLILNKMGLHIIRYTLSHFLFFLRKLFLIPLVSKSFRKQFANDGFVVMPNFLDHDSFVRLKQSVNDFNGEFYEIKEGPTLTRRVHFNWDSSEIAQPILDICKHKKLLRLIRFASSKNRWPSFHLENIIHGKENEHASDPQKVLHSDCFHPTVKAWLFIDDVNEENGPFNYVKSSNQFSWKRLKWEYHQSILASTKLEKANKKRNWDGSFRTTLSDLKLMGYQSPTPVIVSANTLVIANTHGFHFRGSANESSSRMSIWMQCRDNPFTPFFLPSPKLGAMLFNFYRNKVILSKITKQLKNGTIKIKFGNLFN
jgi:hypothetical protein